MGRRVMQKDAVYTRLRERLHGAHDVRVIALGGARARAVVAAPLSAPPAVIEQMRVRT
jgi:hypothetical protein